MFTPSLLQLSQLSFCECLSEVNTDLILKMKKKKTTKNNKNPTKKDFVNDEHLLFICEYVCMCVPILLSAFLTRLHSPEETCSISHAKAVSSCACVVLLSQVLWHQVGCKHVLQVPETAESSLCLKQSDW